MSEAPHATSVHLITGFIRDWLREAGIPAENISPESSLLELGIDSLGAAQIIDSVERSTEKRLNPDYVFSLETIAEFAEYLDSLGVQPQQIDAIAAAPLSAPPRGGLAFFEQMNRRVNSLKQEGRYFFEPVIEQQQGAWVVIGGQRMLMLGSYGYLGLMDHPDVKREAMAAIEEFGAGHHGARLLAGTLTIHRRLEERLAEFMESAHAILFSSGYVANLATISALVGPGDCVIGDQWNHASIVDGCRMSGADFVEFRHNDMESLDESLKQSAAPRKLVVVDAVYSMEGDIADLPPIIDLCRRHDALLMVDEAHSLGVLGATGRGVQEHFNLAPQDIDIKMGTLSKTLGSSGGFVAASEEIITFLRHNARGYIFSGALPASQTAAALASLNVMEREPQRVAQLKRNVEQFGAGLRALGFDTGASQTPIIPIMTRDNEPTLRMTELCREQGLMVIPVAYPAVPMDAPRLRTCVSTNHTPQDIEFALDILAQAGRQTGVIGPAGGA